MKLVVASNNKGKLAEIAQILPQFELIPQGQLFDEEAVEDGLSFIENAIIKARFAAQKTGLPALADDSGLEVAALKGEPGVNSARYSGGGDEANIDKLLANLKGIADRQANFYCAMAFVRHAKDPTPVIGLGKWTGEITLERTGRGGFGYDPVFFVPELNKTAAELLPEEKNALSHRAKALAEIKKQLDSYFESHAI